jgi:hypothetical protein
MRTVAALLLTMLAGEVVMVQSNPLRFGTWVMNIPKSTFDPGPPPMSQMRREERDGDALKTFVEGVDARGNRIAYQFTVRSDGKDYPITGTGVPYGSDTVAFVEADPFTVDATFKKAGKVTGTARAVMSRDGKMLTVTSKGSNAAGRPTHNVTIWEKAP